MSSLFVDHDRITLTSNMTGAAVGVGHAYPSWALDVAPCFFVGGQFVCSSDVSCVWRLVSLVSRLFIFFLFGKLYVCWSSLFHVFRFRSFIPLLTLLFCWLLVYFIRSIVSALWDKSHHHWVEVFVHIYNIWILKIKIVHISQTVCSSVHYSICYILLKCLLAVDITEM